MITAAEANYSELRRRYWDDTKAPKAARMIRTGKIDGDEIDVGWVLRHHRTQAIEDDETWYRDYVDELVHFFSVLEVGAICGAITTNALSDNDRRTAIELLSHPALKRYYERHYPLLLPMLFRRRLLGNGVRSAESVHPFRDFLSLSRTIEGDKSVDTFLWFLDGGTYRDGKAWVDIDDTLESLSSAKQMTRLSKKQGGPLARSVEGFRRFAVFCESFDALLRELDSVPLVRDSFWHAHAYWFQRLRKRLGPTMDQGVDNLLQVARSASNTKYTIEPEERRVLVAEVERHGSDLKRAIGRLTLRGKDANYGAALSALLQ